MSMAPSGGYGGGIGGCWVGEGIRWRGLLMSVIHLLSCSGVGAFDECVFVYGCFFVGESEELV